jgi:hypothetical protein
MGRPYGRGDGLPVGAGGYGRFVGAGA